MRGQILFITDGSSSAQRAGHMAIELALTMDLPIKAMFILDAGWKLLLGDEWMSTSSTRTNFLHWIEKNLNTDANIILTDFSKEAGAKGISIETELKIGRTEKVIVESTVEEEPSLLILPNPHATSHAAAAGLRFNINHLSKKIKCPILLGPQ